MIGRSKRLASLPLGPPKFSLLVLARQPRARKDRSIAAAPSLGASRTNSGDGMTSDFARYSSEDVRALIGEYPLAWIVPQGGPASAAGLLPLLGDFAADGSLAALVGHMARRNPLMAGLQADARATILFSGPQGYVSPRHAGKRNWGPTWNFAQLVLECEIEILPDLTEPAIDRLVEVMEPKGPEAWRSAELGERYPAMVERIIGFRATVRSMTGRFKLGQDEQPDVLNSILSAHPDAALTRWMERMNEGRTDG